MQFGRVDPAAMAAVALSRWLASGVAAGEGQAKAEIIRSKGGIPTIQAESFKDVGFGYGYAFAAGQHLHDRRHLRDRQRRALAVLRARRRYDARGNGTTSTTSTPTSSTSGSRTAASSRSCSRSRRRAGPQPEIKRGGARLRRRLQPLPARDRASTTSPTRPAAASRGCAPITEIDAYRRFYQLGLLASQGVAIDGIADAQPPTGAGAAARGAPSRRRQTLRSASSAPPLGGIGSQRLRRSAARRPTNGSGMVLGNPHFPWDGSERFYQVAAHDPGQGQRRRREPVRRAGDPDRPHATPRLEPHRLDRAAASRRSS